MGILDKIKNDVKKSGSNKGKIMFFKEGVKSRVRFLTDMDEGLEVIFHDSFELGINVPCQEAYGKTCKYCDEEGLRTRSMYAWSVWDYEAKEVKIILSAVNNCAPVPAMMALYETYGTLVDRDYVITTTGKQQNKTFSVVPMDKAKFRNEKAKPFSDSKVLSIIDKAYPAEDSDDDDDVKPSKGKKSSGSKKPKDDEWDDDDNEAMNYSEMTAKELYTLCKERDIECAPKKSEKVYIKLLEEYDAENAADDDDWGDDESDKPDYSEMSPQELYKLCKERDIEATPKKNAKYYINLLEENDKAEDDWGDGGDDNDEWED